MLLRVAKKSFSEAPKLAHPQPSVDTLSNHQRLTSNQVDWQAAVANRLDGVPEPHPTERVWAKRKPWNAMHSNPETVRDHSQIGIIVDVILHDSTNLDVFLPLSVGFEKELWESFELLSNRAVRMRWPGAAI